MDPLEPSSAHTVVLADDHPAVLRSASELLASRFTVVAEVSDGRSAVEAVARLNPDVAVLDIMMPELNGIGAAREIRRNRSCVKIVFLTVQNDRDYVSAALEAGASGYVLKSRMRSDLLSAVEHALVDRVFISALPTPFEHTSSPL